MRRFILRLKKQIDNNLTDIMAGIIGAFIFWALISGFYVLAWIILIICIFMVIANIYHSYLIRKYPKNCPYCGRKCKK